MSENEIPYFIMVDAEVKIIGIFTRDITSVSCDENQLTIYLQDDEYYELKFTSRSRCKKQCAQLIESINRFYNTAYSSGTSYVNGSFYPSKGS